eukprot:g1118.t1
MRHRYALTNVLLFAVVLTSGAERPEADPAVADGVAAAEDEARVIEARERGDLAAAERAHQAEVRDKAKSDNDGKLREKFYEETLSEDSKRRYDARLVEEQNVAAAAKKEMAAKMHDHSASKEARDAARQVERVEQDNEEQLKMAISRVDEAVEDQPREDAEVKRDGQLLADGMKGGRGIDQAVAHDTDMLRKDGTIEVPHKKMALLDIVHGLEKEEAMAGHLASVQTEEETALAKEAAEERTLAKYAARPKDRKAAAAAAKEYARRAKRVAKRAQAAKDSVGIYARKLNATFLPMLNWYETQDEVERDGYRVHAAQERFMKARAAGDVGKQRRALSAFIAAVRKQRAAMVKVLAFDKQKETKALKAAEVFRKNEFHGRHGGESDIPSKGEKEGGRESTSMRKHQLADKEEGWSSSKAYHSYLYDKRAAAMLAEQVAASSEKIESAAKAIANAQDMLQELASDKSAEKEASTPATKQQKKRWAEDMQENEDGRGEQQRQQHGQQVQQRWRRWVTQRQSKSGSSLSLMMVGAVGGLAIAAAVVHRLATRREGEGDGAGQYGRLMTGVSGEYQASGAEEGGVELSEFEPVCEQ